VISYLDTHVVVWLCEGKLEQLSERATQQLQDADVLISPVILLELQYLGEIKRVVRSPQSILRQLQIQIGLVVCDLPFSSVIEAALFENWTRDPFDRMVVAHAKANGYAPLVTADTKIQANYSSVIW
jgi:PIN domain nuclease of toxin-antitoxin system